MFVNSFCVFSMFPGGGGGGADGGGGGGAGGMGIKKKDFSSSVFD